MRRVSHYKGRGAALKFPVPLHPTWSFGSLSAVRARTARTTRERQLPTSAGTSRPRAPDTSTRRAVVVPCFPGTIKRAGAENNNNSGTAPLVQHRTLYQQAMRMCTTAMISESTAKSTACCTRCTGSLLFRALAVLGARLRFRSKTPSCRVFCPHTGHNAVHGWSPLSPRCGGRRRCDCCRPRRFGSAF